MNEEEYRDITVSRRDALYQLDQHGADYDEFYDDLGFHESYKGSEILNWLGY